MEYTENERSFTILGVFLKELDNTSIQKLERAKNFDVQIIANKAINVCIKDSLIEEAVKGLQEIFLSEELILNIAKFTFGIKMSELKINGRTIKGYEFMNSLLNYDDNDLVFVSKFGLVKLTKESIYYINYEYNVVEESIDFSVHVTLGEDDNIDMLKEYYALQKILFNRKEKDFKTIHNRIG